MLPSGFGARLALINKKMILSYGVRRGDFIELEVSEQGGKLLVQHTQLPEITSLSMLVA